VKFGLWTDNVLEKSWLNSRVGFNVGLWTNAVQWSVDAKSEGKVEKISANIQYLLLVGNDTVPILTYVTGVHALLIAILLIGRVAL